MTGPRPRTTWASPPHHPTVGGRSKLGPCELDSVVDPVGEVDRREVVADREQALVPARPDVVGEPGLVLDAGGHGDQVGEHQVTHVGLGGESPQLQGVGVIVEDVLERCAADERRQRRCPACLVYEHIGVAGELAYLVADPGVARDDDHAVAGRHAVPDRLVDRFVVHGHRFDADVAGLAAPHLGGRARQFEAADQHLGTGRLDVLDA